MYFILVTCTQLREKASGAPKGRPYTRQIQKRDSLKAVPTSCTGGADGRDLARAARAFSWAFGEEAALFVAADALVGPKALENEFAAAQSVAARSLGFTSRRSTRFEQSLNFAQAAREFPPTVALAGTFSSPPISNHCTTG